MSRFPGTSYIVKFVLDGDRESAGAVFSRLDQVKGYLLNISGQVLALASQVRVYRATEVREEASQWRPKAQALYTSYPVTAQGVQL